MAGADIAGRYRLRKRLGRGGMGEVWEAVDLRLNRAVAIKLLAFEPHGADGDERAVARFRREAEIAAGLQHDGIAVHYDAGRDGGRLYLVMELLAGRDLAAVMREHHRGLPPGTVRELGAQIAEALDAAHGRGVVHRDVKPANIMVLPGNRVKILDFGIARYADRTSDLTGSGIVGTPAYMPPERFEKGTRPDVRGDLYALGAVLFVMLTGRPPFAADTVGTLVKKIVLDPPPRVRELRPETPEDLDGLVAALLAKNPGDRPQSAGQVAAVLRGRSTWRAVRPDAATVRLARDTARLPARGRRPVDARRLVGAVAGVVVAASVIAGVLLVRNAVDDGEYERVPRCARLRPSSLPAEISVLEESALGDRGRHRFCRWRTADSLASLDIDLQADGAEFPESATSVTRRNLDRVGTAVPGLGEEAFVADSERSANVRFRLSNLRVSVEYAPRYDGDDMRSRTRQAALTLAKEVLAAVREG
ncbi:hypothetical protein Acsp04_18610 [Actinomadura sp. NBRC 104425]|nr:hypothetical protein Acsp04_18610 [Actinomadura sp. NBRC 104425]